MISMLNCAFFNVNRSTVIFKYLVAHMLSSFNEIPLEASCCVHVWTSHIS